MSVFHFGRHVIAMIRMVTINGGPCHMAQSECILSWISYQPCNPPTRLSYNSLDSRSTRSDLLLFDPRPDLELGSRLGLDLVERRAGHQLGQRHLSGFSVDLEDGLRGEIGMSGLCYHQSGRDGVGLTSSVMIMLTQRAPVNGKEHVSSILGRPFLSQ